MQITSTNYTNYQLLERVRLGGLMAAAGLALVLWTSCCYLVLKSRQRSLRWLPLAGAGPFGFIVIATLEEIDEAYSLRVREAVEAGSYGHE